MTSGHGQSKMAGSASSTSTLLPRYKLSQLVSVLEVDAERICKEATDAVYEEIASYSSVPIEDVEQSVYRNFRRSIKTLVEGRPPLPEEIEEAWVAIQRCEQGIPVDDMVWAFRISLRAIRNAFLHYAQELSLRQADMVAGTTLLWDMVDAVTVQLAKLHRDTAVEKALHDERLKVSFVRDLLSGSVDFAQLRTLAPAYGIRVNDSYHALRAQPFGSTSLSELQVALEQAGGEGKKPAFLSVLGGQVCGVVARKPRTRTLPAVAGVGPLLPLHLAAQSYYLASRVLSAGLQLGESGCLDLSDLSWKIALVDEPELGAQLLRKYFDPLCAHGEFGQVVATTVGSYFQHDRNLARTALALHIHPNTLRYRLRRFEEITECSLSSTETVLELTWALAVRSSGLLAHHTRSNLGSGEWPGGIAPPV